MRISNRLAVFAAITLVISALAGMGNLPQSSQDATGQLAEIQSGLMDQAATSSSGSGAAQGSKGFISTLFLFRNN
jgi:hypothetical protein